MKNFKNPELVDEIILLDTSRKKIQYQTDSLQAELNKIAKEIGLLMKSGKILEAEQLKKRNTEIKEETSRLNQELTATEEKLSSLLVQLPNLPHDSVPVGRSAEDNIVIRSGNDIPLLPDNAMPHWDLAKKYDIIDFELGNKLTGAGFPVYKGER
ncbi:MAG: hypothetical protein HC830_06805 [Bacteroidetes bacterium]|nr:hypothetical protein [Bacteroidota bacterium]